MNKKFECNNKYDGEWKDGLREGFGQFSYADGGRYEGIWDKNRKHGVGKFTFENGRYIHTTQTHNIAIQTNHFIQKYWFL